ncbi:MAG: PqqD family peptide modification chaperone [Armatimonadota bacterium]
MQNLQTFANQFVESTRDYIFIRPEDSLVIMRPNKTHHLNEVAREMLSRLYAQPAVDVAVLVDSIAGDYGEKPEVVAKDLEKLLQTLNGLLRDDYSQASQVKFTPFKTHEIKFPVLSEIALTYRCQHKCPFCYADAPRRGGKVGEMTAEQVCRIIDCIRDDAHVPTISFTGGEPTLVPDLPRWVARAKAQGMTVVVQTNGLLAWRDDFWDSFRDATGRAVLPDCLFVSFHTRHPDRVEVLTGLGQTFLYKVAAVRAAVARGVHVELNFVIQNGNLDEVPTFPAFVLETFGAAVSIMFSVVAPTGRSSQRPDLWPTMNDLAPRLASALQIATALGIRVSIPEACGVPICVLPSWRSVFQSLSRDRDVGPPAEDRVKPPLCSTCAVNERCIGIWRRYAEVHGTGEFVPILDPGGNQDL